MEPFPRTVINSVVTCEGKAYTKASCPLVGHQRLTHGTQSTKVINKVATTLGRKRALPARTQSRACPLWAEALGATRENPRAWAPLAPSPAPAYSQLLKESPLPSAAPPCPAGRPTGGSAAGARPLPTFPTRPTPQMLAIRSLDPKQQDIPPTPKWLPSPAGGQAIPTLTPGMGPPGGRGSEELGSGTLPHRSGQRLGEAGVDSQTQFLFGN